LCACVPCVRVCAQCNFSKKRTEGRRRRVCAGQECGGWHTDLVLEKVNAMRRREHVGRRGAGSCSAVYKQRHTNGGAGKVRCGRVWRAGVAYGGRW